MTKPTPGDIAWLGIVAYVAIYDAWAIRTHRDTLSSSYYRAIQSPVRRWPTVAAAVVLYGHLTRALPERMDPLRRWRL